MVAVESFTRTMAFPCGPSSYHYADSASFNLSDGSLNFDLYDEATEPVYPEKTTKNSTPPISSPPSIVARADKEDPSSSWTASDNTNKKKKKLSRRLSFRSSASSQSKKRRKTSSKVRFSPTVEVRTHSIVLGEHPFCEDGLALELGWDYEDSRDFCHQGWEQIFPKWRKLFPNYALPKKSSMRASSHPRQLSTLERKSILLEVGGCSEIEIKLRQFQASILLQVQRLQEERVQTSPNGDKSKTDFKSGALYAAMA